MTPVSSFRRSRLRRLAWIMAGVLACMTIRANAELPCWLVWIDRPQSPEFEGRCTFGFLHNRRYLSYDPLTNQPCPVKRIRAAIGCAMERRGYRYSSGHPDVLVTYHILLSERDYGMIAHGFDGYRLTREQWIEAPPSKVMPRQPELGTLVVDFIEPGTRTIFLRAWRQTSLVNLMEWRSLKRNIDCIVNATMEPVPDVPPDSPCVAGYVK